MEKYEEIKLRNQLHSNDPNEIKEALVVLRDTGNEIFIDVLAGILCNTDNHEIYTLILKIFDDLKNKNAVPEIVKVLKDKSYEKEKRNLVSSCWKSGLNFSEDLDVFFEIFVKDDFSTAFEAYTVLETNIPDIKPVNARRYLSYLSEKRNKITSDRTQLASILETMLQD